MRRDTKLNLLFLGLFLAISLPGAVILFRKKLNPQSRPIFMSDEVDRRVPYMFSAQTPPGYRRVIPPRTQAWLTDIVRQKTGQPQVASQVDARGNPQPILSEDHQLQLVASDAKSDTIALIWWNPAVQADRVAVRLAIDNRPQTSSISQTQNLELPQDVRLELLNLGLLKVPKTVTWVQLKLTVIAADSQLLEVELQAMTDSQLLRSRLALPLPGR